MATKIATKATAWYRCKETFHADTPRYAGTVMQGELVRGNHAAVKAFPQFFEPLDGIDRPDVESATAAPGEKR
jgi:hypothetical protein